MALTKIKLNEVDTKATPVLADSIVISDSENSGKGALVEITDLQTLIGGGGGGGAVDSVAGKTGVVTLDADDVAPTATKLWMSDTQQSMIDGLSDALAAKAPLASPTLTGTPTAPTAASGTDTTQIATTEFVQDALAGVTASSIGLGSVDNTSDINKPVSTAQAAALALKQDKSNAITTDTNQEVTGTKTYRTSALYYGPATPVNHTPFGFGCGGVAYWGTRQYTNGNLVWQSFPTGGGSAQNALGFIFGSDGSVPSIALYNTPTAPTAAAGTNTTQLATTAFVQAATARAIYDLPVTRSGLVSAGTDVVLFETGVLDPAWYDETHVLNVSFFARNDSGINSNTTFKVQLYYEGTSTAHTITSITADTLDFDLLQASIYRTSSSSVNCNIQYGNASGSGYVSLAAGSYKLRVVCTSTISTVFGSAQVRFTK